MDEMPLLPTPTARDDGKSPEAHMRMKARMEGGPRQTITSLAVLARAGFSQPEACSPASADSTLESLSLSGPSPPGSARPTRTADRFSRATGPTSLVCPTCGKSTPGSDGSTCCMAATPANPSPSPESERARTTLGISGRSSPDAFAFYDPDSSCWRTSQATLLSDSTPCSLTLPKWGSLHGGALYEHPTWEPRTGAHDCSALPTPTSSDYKGAGLNPQRYADRFQLAGIEALLPTPTTDDANNISRASGTFDSLAREVHLLPTPNASDGPKGGPNRRDGKGKPYLTGAFTSPRSDAGSTRSDDQHPGQLTIGDA